MNTEEIRAIILRELYQQYFLSDESFRMKPFWETLSFEERAFINIIDRMRDEGLLKGRAGWAYDIKPEGIILFEQQSIYSKELIQRNDRIRTRILLTLADVYENQGTQYTFPKSGFYENNNEEAIIIDANLRFLRDTFYVESTGNARYKITVKGIKIAEAVRKTRRYGDEFDATSQMENPQARGRALQKLFASFIREQGWDCQEGARTAGEEMDVIISREREFWLTECKWEKKPIGAAVIREMYGKLGNRVDVKGIVISMSGFTGPADTQAEDYIGQKLILLFGEQDIKELFFGEISFTDLLNAKYKDAVTKRKITFR